MVRVVVVTCKPLCWGDWRSRSFSRDSFLGEEGRGLQLDVWGEAVLVRCRTGLDSEGVLCLFSAVSAVCFCMTVNCNGNCRRTRATKKSKRCSLRKRPSRKRHTYRRTCVTNRRRRRRRQVPLLRALRLCPVSVAIVAGCVCFVHAFCHSASELMKRSKAVPNSGPRRLTDLDKAVCAAESGAVYSSRDAMPHCAND